MAFNIYEWRRNQLLTESSIHPDPKDLTTNPEANIKQDREQLFQRLLKDFENDPEAIEIIKKQMKNLKENSDNDKLKVGKHPKITVSKFDWAYLPGKDKLEVTKITKSVIDSLPDELMYTGMQYSKDAQKAIPRFKLAEKPEDKGDSMKGFDPEEEKRYAEKRKKDKNI